MYKGKWFYPVEFTQDRAALYGFTFGEEDRLVHYIDSLSGRYYVQINSFGDFVLVKEGDIKNYIVLKRLKYMHELIELMRILNVKQIKENG